MPTVASLLLPYCAVLALTRNCFPLLLLLLLLCCRSIWCPRLPASYAQPIRAATWCSATRGASAVDAGTTTLRGGAASSAVAAVRGSCSAWNLYSARKLYCVGVVGRSHMLPLPFPDTPPCCVSWCVAGKVELSGQDKTDSVLLSNEDFVGYSYRSDKMRHQHCFMSNLKAVSSALHSLEGYVSGKMHRRRRLELQSRPSSTPPLGIKTKVRSAHSKQVAA